MTTTTITVEATLQPDGVTLQLEKQLSLPPGRVTVTVQCENLATSSEEIPRSTVEAREQATELKREAGTEASRPRNIAVAYEEVVLTEEDAEILRQMREAPTAPAGRPT